MTQSEKLNLIICNQLAIMTALEVVMGHFDTPQLGKMCKTWQFNQLQKMIEQSARL